MRRMWTWLKTHNEPVSVVVSILTLVVAAVGFWFTWDQIAQTTKALQAGNTYQIQKDGRDIINKINAEGALFTYLAGDRKPETVKQAKIDFWNVNNFYLSVYRQANANGLSKEFVAQFKADYCDFIDNTKLQSLVKDLQQRGTIGRRSTTMKEHWCGKK